MIVSCMHLMSVMISRIAASTHDPVQNPCIARWFITLLSSSIVLSTCVNPDSEKRMSTADRVPIA